MPLFLPAYPFVSVTFTFFFISCSELLPDNFNHAAFPTKNFKNKVTAPGFCSTIQMRDFLASSQDVLPFLVLRCYGGKQVIAIFIDTVILTWYLKLISFMSLQFIKSDLFFGRALLKT